MVSLSLDKDGAAGVVLGEREAGVVQGTGGRTDG